MHNNPKFPWAKLWDNILEYGRIAWEKSTS